MAPFPTKTEIEQLASALATKDASSFFDRVSPSVVWDVLGTSPASGHFTSLESWKKGALGSANNVLSAPLEFKVANVFGGGEQPWAALELEAINAFGKDGTPYPQTYCWLLRFNEQGIIVQVRVYADTQLFQTLVDKNS